MRRIVILLLILMWSTLRGQDSYSEFIFKVSQSCQSPQLLLATAFTNDVIVYRTTNTNIQAQCAADLALAISLMHRMDNDEECVASDECLGRHQSLVSNIVFCSSLDVDSWLRYAAAVEYITGLNYGNHQNAAFALATNMIERINVYPPNMGVTNYWNSMAGWMKSPNESMATVFRINAAIWLAEQNRIAELVSLTNSLPNSAINIFLEELN